MFRNPLQLRDDPKLSDGSTHNPFGRLGSDDDEPDTEITDIKNPTTLQAPVGDTGQNRRRDVAKTEQLLGKAGALDLKKTDGPTGYRGTRTSDATKTFQKKNGLKVDGQINPGGETIRALGKLKGQVLKAAQSSNNRSAGARGAKTNSNVVIPAKAGTQSNVSTNWVPDQVRDDKDVGGVKLSNDAFSENQRAARYLASRDGIGEFSKFVTDGIETDGDKAVAETFDLYRQTAEMNQDQADALINKVLPSVSSENAKRLKSAIASGDHNQNEEQANPDQKIDNIDDTEQKVLIRIQNHELNVRDILARLERFQEQLSLHQESFKNAERAWQHAVASAPASVAKDISAGARTGPFGALVGAVSAGVSLKNARDRFDIANENLNGTRTSLENLNHQLEEQYTLIESLRGQLRQSK